MREGYLLRNTVECSVNLEWYNSKFRLCVPKAKLYNKHHPMLSTKMPGPKPKIMPITQKRNSVVKNCSGSIHRTRENHEIKYLKKDQWHSLIESIDNYRDKLIVKLLYSTGMRVGELAKLKVEDIDFHERFIHISAENTKTNTARTVIVQPEQVREAYEKRKDEVELYQEDCYGSTKM